ncbi:MAG: helix-turn-helix transcriptional regulator [Bacteroidota bacterium]
MTTRSQLETALKLLLYLSGSFGYSMNEIREKFSISERTAYRYLHIIKEVGFLVERTNGYYRVNKNEGEGKSLGDLLHFSEEEAWILSKAIHSIDDTVGIKNALVKKLYSLYDFGRVAQPIIKKEYSENIHNIINAIKEKKQILLRDYKSANSNMVRDRLVEPISFTTNFISVWCYEPESRENKLFKTARIGKAEILQREWQNAAEHQPGEVDVFRMSSFDTLPVKLRLSLRAANLLCEEYPLAEKYLLPENDNRFIFETGVCSYEGVGRFVMGLLDELEILETEAFKKYIKEKLKNNGF